MKEVSQYGQHCIMTYSGIILDLSNPQTLSICIEDIARGLSLKYRFGGHSKSAMSVAEHSLNVAASLPAEIKLEGLLHDASEAYIGDIPSPIKSLLPDYKVFEERLMKAIAKAFGLMWPLPMIVKEADQEALTLEWEHVVLKGGMVMTADMAYNEFMQAFERLSKLRQANHTAAAV